VYFEYSCEILRDIIFVKLNLQNLMITLYIVPCGIKETTYNYNLSFNEFGSKWVNSGISRVYKSIFHGVDMCYFCMGDP
jgi:hypothetical protein